MSVVVLNRVQTKMLTRLFKKVDVSEMRFEQTNGEDLIFVVTDAAGWCAAVMVGATGDLDSIRTKTGKFDLTLHRDSLMEIFSDDPVNLLEIPGVAGVDDD